MAAVKLLSMQLMGKEQTHDRGAECDDRRFDNQDALRLLISSVQDVTMQSVANNCQQIKHPIGCTLQGKASTDIARQGQVGTVDMKLFCAWQSVIHWLIFNLSSLKLQTSLLHRVKMIYALLISKL